MARYVCSDAYNDLIWVLKITGTMPYKNTDLQQKIRATIPWLWLVGLLTTMVMEIFISYDNVEDMCDVLYLFGAIIDACIKKYAYMKSDQLIRIFEMLDSVEFNNQNENSRKPLDICVIKAKKLIKSFLYLIGSISILYAIFPLFDDKPLSIPFSYDLGNYTAYFRWFQVGGCIIAAFCIVGMAGLGAVLLMIAAAQVDILRLKLIGDRGNNSVGEKLEEDQLERDEKIHKNLKECVHLHLCIIEYVAELEKLYSAPMLSQYTVSMAVICLVMMQIIFMAEFPSFRLVFLVLIYMGLTFQLVIYHYFGNELVIKSSEIVEACYCSEWYYYDPKARSMLLIIMERTKRPLYLSIYGFDMVTLSSFLKVYKWSYSMFAVLRSIYKD